MITILHTNDIHGHLLPWQGWEGELAGKQVGGLDRLATRVRQVRAEVGPERVLLLDGGDTIGDNMIAAETEGRAVIEAMNAIGYDAMVMGNHEPDFTAEKLRSRIAEARFPVLAANIQLQGGGRFATPYVVREVNGIRIGILGIAYPNTPLTTAQKNVQSLRFREAVKTAREYVPRMKEEGADIVVALTHLGLSADKALAEKVSDIDVIVGGHSHNRMKQAMRAGNTLIVQAGAHGSDLGQLDLNVAQKKIVSHRRSLLPIMDIDADPPLANLIAGKVSPLKQKMTARVGRASGIIARAQTIAGEQPEKRDAESPADDLFADAIRETAATELAFLPGVGYGVALHPGEVTADCLRNLLPHDSAVWTMKLTGGQIREVLEQSIENFMTEETTKKVGGMIQVSGLRFSYEPNAGRGRRVREVSVSDSPLSPDRHYTVAVNALLAEGGHNYRAFSRGIERREIGKQYEIVRAWIERHGEISSPISNRIIKLSEAKK